MRPRHLAFLLAAGLVPGGCASSPPPAPPAPASAATAPEAPPASPAAAAEKLGGLWLLSIERNGKSVDHSLHIALTEGILVGSLTGPDGNGREVSNVTLRADKVSWEIPGQGGSQRFEGKLTGQASMEGTLHFVRSRNGQGRSGGGGGRGGGSRGGSDSGDDGSSTGSSSPPPGDDPPASGGGRSGGGYGGRGGRGGRGGGRGGSDNGKITWKAYKSVEPDKAPEASKPASGS